MRRHHLARATAAAAVPVRWALVLLAVLSLAVGIVGIFVPVLPTVPFVLLAAWAAARSSPRLSAWLEGHPRFGRYIREWRQGGVVRRPAKWAASLAMSASALIILATVGLRWPAALSIGTMACVGAWLWRRPEHPPA
ncbi:YbaN family protein [Ramlibacter solisilvae]|uniref:Membrane protein n=1 Tax=Ramlibacter tataouinensis TaxID=94132 RepID=A0A127JYN7_9BURK|nr:YbaN family protein [Ramlibacter tataouinensis]AMO25097.1 membrane protein [Ramlibacter tataouinensis]